MMSGRVVSADIELSTVMITIVFCSLIIHEFDKFKEWSTV
jgi:hypothetical protein